MQQHPRATRAARTLRGVAAASIATLTAAVSHTLAGAEFPALGAVALGLAFSVMVCMVLAGKTLSLGRISASVVLSQLAYHGLFLVAPGGASVSVSGADPLAHAHGAAGSVALVSSGAGHDPFAHGPWMLVAHAAAALLTILAIRSGEAAFWSLVHDGRRLVVRVAARVDGLAALVLASLSGAVALPRRRRAAHPSLALPRRLELVLAALRHRGPPAGRALPHVFA